MIIDEDKIIKAYNDGQSMTSIAKDFGTYATSVKRILEKRKIPLRHDVKRAGSLYVKGGEELIEWAKTQGRPVTKEELAQHLGRRRLSPSYFEKYPELGQYVEVYDQQDLQKYLHQLFTWLKENHIPYKPNDRKKLGVSVDALLLSEYEGVAIQLVEKPYRVSKKIHERNLQTKVCRAKEIGMHIIFIDKNCFKNLDILKSEIEEAKKIGKI